MLKIGTYNLIFIISQISRKIKYLSLNLGGKEKQMNGLKVFSNSEFGELGVLVIDGKEWFPATQCAKILGYTNPQKAVRDHCKGVNKMFTPTAGGSQEANYISEGDLYRLIVSSKLPAAEKFERWVFDEVLPSIRHNGGYVPNVEELIAKTATAVVSEVMKQIIPFLSQIPQPQSQPKTQPQQYAFVKNEISEARFLHKTIPTIDLLDKELKAQVLGMMASGMYSSMEISEFLAINGVKLSQPAVSRYKRNHFKIIK